MLASNETFEDEHIGRLRGVASVYIYIHMDGENNLLAAAL